MHTNDGEITMILRRIEDGDPEAAGRLLPLVYGELRRLAAAKMGRETRDQTLQPTALVHEAWLRLGGDQQPGWAKRANFFGPMTILAVPVASCRPSESELRSAQVLRPDVPDARTSVVAPRFSDASGDRILANEAHA